jgi:hypothetical protein
VVKRPNVGDRSTPTRFVSICLGPYRSVTVVACTESDCSTTTIWLDRLSRIVAGSITAVASPTVEMMTRVVNCCVRGRGGVWLPGDCYSSAMRRSAVMLVLAALAVAACSGSNEAATTDPTTTSVPATTAAEPTTTTDAVTTTVVETTAAPPTTVDDESRLRAAEQAYIESWEAYHAAILDPSDPELRAEVERTNTGLNLEAAISTLDGFVEENYVARAHLDQPAEVSVLTAAMPVPGELNLVDLIACEVNSESYFEVGSAPDGGDALARDEVVVLRLLVRIRFVDGKWKTESGEILSRRTGDVGCLD